MRGLFLWKNITVCVAAEVRLNPDWVDFTFWPHNCSLLHLLYSNLPANLHSTLHQHLLTHLSPFLSFCFLHLFFFSFCLYLFYFISSTLSFLFFFISLLICFSLFLHLFHSFFFLDLSSFRTRSRSVFLYFFLSLSFFLDLSFFLSLYQFFFISSSISFFLLDQFSFFPENTVTHTAFLLSITCSIKQLNVLFCYKPIRMIMVCINGTAS